MNRNLRPSSKVGTQEFNSNYRSKQYDGKIAGLYDLEETLGRGHFAVVKLARHVFTGEKVAVKVIDKSKLDEVSKAHLFQEVRCMKLVQHPNVVRLYEVIDTATKLYLVLELGDGGDLYEYIMRHETGLPEKVAKEYFSQIVRAISYCHQLHVVHRDLKPENVVFFKKQGIVKLTDFGFSNKFYPGQKLETSCGSLAYSAPEILLGDSYDAPAVDVWSLGVILYMLVCGQPPFQEANDSETLTMIMDCKYDIPLHVSQNCRNLISRMLLRNPEKRATLIEISKHPWLSSSKTVTVDSVPLVSREHLSDEDHNLIVQKIVNGNVATKEEIQESLDKNDYNHITATYFLLAERKLRCKRQEQAAKTKRPEELAVFQTQDAKKDASISIKPNLLNVPRTPGDLPQRSRKCSIVQEDEEEEDISSCAGREDLAPTLNRRGSRSEGRLNLTLQERLAESEKRKPIELKYPASAKKSSTTCNKSQRSDNKLPLGTLKTIAQPPVISIFASGEECKGADVCSGAVIPEVEKNASRHTIVTCNPSSYERRRAKFHKSRTASCSSSDASDDDSEKRKKRAQKLNTPSKSIETRRDSHDDSSDSQEPGTGAGPSGFTNLTNNSVSFESSSNNTETTDQKEKHGTCNDKNERNHANSTFERNHRICRKKGNKTRLRESQSLNRITEVQEDNTQTLVVSTTLLSMPGSLTPKVKSVGAKIFNGLSRSSKKPPEKTKNYDEKLRMSRRDSVGRNLDRDIECNKLEKCGIRKIRMLGKYFHVQKKICIPLAGLFRRNGLYKAQSCSSLTKDRILTNPNLLQTRSRPVSCIKSDGDINQNEPLKPFPESNKNVLDSVCSELKDICTVHVHIGQASKCSFC
ncbi:uncharacterized protein Snrk [Diabrotica undecimpunctata]|uniref:uncharacterized protein Snrk n=1 Tax=Diabrotica undecimpunctata TaxID=50387 RepID=UPI003B63A923